MSQENKIDFIPKQDFFDYQEFEVPYDARNGHISEIIGEIIKEVHGFKGFAVGYITFIYLRINGISPQNKLNIPQNALSDSLAFNKGENFFVKLFNRFKLISEANEQIADTASIPRAIQRHRKLLRFRWTTNGENISRASN